MKIISLLSLVLLSGCVSTQDLTKEEVPPILFNANIQSHVLVIMGSESSAKWDSVYISTKNNIKPCEVKHPTSGPILPGEAIHIITETSIDDCKLELYYDNKPIGAWLFQPNYAVEIYDSDRVESLNNVTVSSSVSMSNTTTISPKPTQNETVDGGKP